MKKAKLAREKAEKEKEEKLKRSKHLDINTGHLMLGVSLCMSKYTVCISLRFHLGALKVHASEGNLCVCEHEREGEREKEASHQYL